MKTFVPVIRATVMLICTTMLVGCPQGQGLNHGDNGGDGGYTILLTAFSSANHNNNAKYTRDALKGNGWQDLMIVHKDSHSELLWGNYETMPAAQADLRKARAYASQNGARPFVQARVIATPGRDVGPPQWKLITAKGTYTVVAAYYYDVPEEKYMGRRRRAVEFCKYLRDKGNEAYYHHGPVKSYVTVGTLTEGAVQTVQTDTKVETVISEEVRATIRRLPVPVLSENGNKKILLVHVAAAPGQKQPWRRAVVLRPYPVKIPRRRGEDLPGSTHEGAGVWTRHN